MIYDTDGVFGEYEHRIKVASLASEIEFLWVVFKER